MNKKIGLVIFGIFFISFSLAQIPTFHQFYGSVLDVHGVQITQDVSVKAYINGNLVQTQISDNGHYGYSELFLVENRLDGEIITFTLDNYFSANYTFTNEEITQLDLVLNQSSQLICIDNDSDGYSQTGGNCGSVDCNDYNSAVNPGATELCNGIDDNCDGQVDEGCGNGDGNSCFPAGTGILMGDKRYKKIEDVLVGDYVASYDEQKKEIVVAEVLELEFPVREHMCKINFDDNSELKLTNEHPVYTNEGWKSINPLETVKENSGLEVDKLKIGDKVVFVDGNKFVKEINCWDEVVQTYNLKKVSGTNNYFAEGVLVHNKNGNGGGGDGDTYFDLDKKNINVTIIQGESVEKEFTVTNPTSSFFTIYFESDLNMINVENSFSLGPDQSRTVKVNITTEKNQTIDLYVGHIRVWTNSDEEEILVSIEVVSSDTLFDMIIYLSEDDLSVLPGKSIFPTFFLTKLTQEQIGEVIIKYIIKSEDGKVIFTSEETRTITGEDSFVKEFEIPAGTDYGNYVLYSQLDYGGKIASANAWFNIGPKNKFIEFSWIIVGGILILIVGIIIVILYIRRKKAQEEVEDTEIPNV